MAKHLIPGIILCALFAVNSPRTLAQQANTASADNSDSTAPPIEEIVITGAETLSSMQLRIGKLESEIFDFFNANNSSDRMNIVCSSRKPVGSNIARRVCEPKFLTDLRVQKTRDARIGIGVDFVERDLVQWAAQDFAQLQKEMLALMTSHKDFSAAMDQLAALAAEYEARKTGNNRDD